MKVATAFLIISLATNLCLAAIFVTRRSQKHDDIPRFSNGAIADHEAPDSAPAWNGVTAQTGAVAKWAALRIGTDRDFAARLQAEGFPESVIAAIARAEVTARFAERRRDIEAMKDRIPWWQTGFGYEFDTHASVSSTERALARDIAAAIQQGFGTAYAGVQYMSPATMQREYGNLSVEKVLRIQSIQRDYADMAADLRVGNFGVTLSEDRQRLAFLQEEKRRDIAASLTLRELEDYDLRTSQTAGTLRGQLWAFEPTENEYLALYAIRKPLDERFAALNPSSAAVREARSVAEAELESQIAATLGPERYADYKITTDRYYQPVRFLLARYELPATAAKPIVALQQQTVQRAEVLRNDASLAPAERDARLVALAQSATEQLKQTLGSPAFEEYSRNTGNWIDRLQPQARP